MRRIITLLVVASALSCKPSGNKVEKQLAELKAKQAAEAQAKADARDKRLNPQVEAVKLDAPYDDTQATVILPDGPCPEGLWALFGGTAPGDTPAEQKANAAKRGELAAAAKAKQYIVKLRGTPVKLSAYDAPKGKFDVEVAGTIDCTDSIGRIAIAWTKTRAGDPGNSAGKEGAEVTQNVWLAEPVVFELPMKSLNEAKEWDTANRFGLSARVAFKPGKVEVDKKSKRVAKVTEKAHGETLAFGGGSEDWGAGRMLHADVLGIRVATQGEKTQLFEKK